MSIVLYPFVCLLLVPSVAKVLQADFSGRQVLDFFLILIVHALGMHAERSVMGQVSAEDKEPHITNISSPFSILLILKCL
ncbi:hypothetical protein BT63DRAFT_260927 [Microthyrium microscopicum]|uniref:Cation/H+ exchanger domain-containing protein n=1 Tax=Microthyrium microscopicum TaxID=703497 RepID=A0A6A6UDH4_9PEZI|nr:hypothetical protein BT63DRAFT_260927 [Microthyrium microscopicum]